MAALEQMEIAGVMNVKEEKRQLEMSDAAVSPFAAIIAECMAPERGRVKSLLEFCHWLRRLDCSNVATTVNTKVVIDTLSPPPSETKEPKI